MRRKHLVAAQLWYSISQGAPAFINPFINIFFRTLGFSPGHVGLLSALRPWVSAPCGSLVAGLADRWQAHRAALLVTYLAMTLLQGSMALASSFLAMLLLTLAASTVYTPPSVIADACVMAASEHPGDYGRLRTWASISWTAFAPLAGYINSTWGIRVGIGCYVLGSLLALPAAWMLPLHSLRSGVPPLLVRAVSAAAREEAAAAAAAVAALPLEKRPLLAEEAPPPTPRTPRGRMLSKALAIVRYVEAITELGAAMPPGAALYGYADLPMPYASRHLAPPRSEQEGAAAVGAEALAETGGGHGEGEGGASPFAAHAPFSEGLLQGALPDVEWGQRETASAPATPGGRPLPAPSTPTSPTFQRPPPSLPRPISAGDLPRVASLAGGIARIRMRLLPLAPSAELKRGMEAGEEEGAAGDGTASTASPAGPSSPMAEAAGAAAPQPLVFDADEEEEVAVARKAAAVEEGGGVALTPAPPQLGGMRHAPSAGTLLAGLRGAQAAAAGGEAAAAEGSGDLPVSTSAAAPATEETPGPAPGATPATPQLRSAAVQSLAQIFSRAGGPAGDTGGTGGEGAGESGAGRGGAASRSVWVEEEMAPELPTGTWQGLLSPVRQYIEHRRAKLEAQQRRTLVDEVAAGGEGELHAVPPAPSGLAAALLAGAGVPLEAPAWLAHVQHEVTPELMQEAIELEAHELTDPTGSMIVSMLGKKLERMAAEARREARRRRRHLLEAEAAAAQAAGAAAAGPVPLAPPAIAGAAPPAEAAPPGLGSLFRDPGTLVFFAVVTLLGIGHGIIGSFLFIFLAELGGNEALMGYVLIANAAPELPAFYFFGAVLQALGMNTVLLLSVATLGLRIAGYTLLPRLGVWWVLPLEALHAVTYAAGWSACALNSSKIAPPGLESTTQAITQGLWTGVGCGLGGLLSGLLYASAGPRALFLASGGIIVAGALACGTAMLVLRSRHKALAASASYASLPAG